MKLFWAKISQISQQSVYPTQDCHKSRSDYIFLLKSGLTQVVMWRKLQWVMRWMISDITWNSLFSSNHTSLYVLFLSHHSSKQNLQPASDGGTAAETKFKCKETWRTVLLFYLVRVDLTATNNKLKSQCSPKGKEVSDTTLVFATVLTVFIAQTRNCTYS